MKKKMKTNRTRKMSILLLAMLLAFTLSGCGASSKNFEAAAELRDKIVELKQQLQQM